MEKYFAQTQGLLNVLQATSSKEELKRAEDAGTEIWDSIRAISDKYQLNVQEMMNATIACHLTIIEAALEQIQERMDGADS
ncbi:MULTISPECIES: hypothetical protein [Bacillus subtilis group]|uniref:hypothetical protein n=1 Tax=Bacillus subtilis group TaxID=653685 RepID=UPI001B148A54|nr:MULTISPECIES: hypothetical protein [Bacillus subtilis group]MED4338025.1 hypothetical protein [Bacillus licheniformis]MED4370971.1 hypothetical protein [Bacillus licheniformis]GIN55101.1 hypothetical protein J36TS2_39950 [Bacillus paralicheniformis]